MCPAVLLKNDTQWSPWQLLKLWDREHWLRKTCIFRGNILAEKFQITMEGSLWISAVSFTYACYAIDTYPQSLGPDFKAFLLFSLSVAKGTCFSKHVTLASYLTCNIWKVPEILRLSDKQHNFIRSRNVKSFAAKFKRNSFDVITSLRSLRWGSEWYKVTSHAQGRVTVRSKDSYTSLHSNIETWRQRRYHVNITVR